MKEEVRALWDLCFGEDEAFTELYFTKRYNDDVNLVIQENGKIISALQMLPYSMTFCGDIIPTAYISGACTHPEYRNKGTMKQLLADSFFQMFKSNIPLTTLIPAEEWLFKYYSKVGYTPIFEFSNHFLKAEELTPCAEYHITEFFSPQTDIYLFFNQKMKERPCCIQHTEEDFNVILEDLHLGKGKLLVAKLKEKIVGLAFCHLKDRTLHVSELFFENESIRDTLLYKAIELMGANKINCIIPPTKDKNKALGMARILDAEKMLHLYASYHKELEISFNLTDDLIKKNNAFYSMKRGEIYKKGTKASSLKINIQQLTQALMGYKIDLLPNELQIFPEQKPYMSLMLN